MNIRKTVCAAAVFGCVAAATAADEVAEAEKGEVEETPIVSAEFGLQLDSKYMTYGVVDGKDPILTPSHQGQRKAWRLRQPCLQMDNP